MGVRNEYILYLPSSVDRVQRYRASTEDYCGETEMTAKAELK
jgi:hypothetical protein